MDNATADRKKYWAGWIEDKRKRGLCTSCGKKKSVDTRCRSCKNKRKETARSGQAAKKLLKKRYRAEVIVLLGAKCACCGEDTPGFLTIEHKNNDGNRERRECDQLAMYRAILKGGRPDIELACFNCNCGRAANGGVCPHKM